MSRAYVPSFGYPTTLAQRHCATWLEHFLDRSGPVPVGEIRAAAKAAGYQWRTVLKVAARDCHIRPVNHAARGGRWTWALPYQLHIKEDNT